MTTTDMAGRRPRSPEEIVLDGWLEDVGPYVKLELQAPKWKRAGKSVEPDRGTPYDPSAV